MNMNALPKRLKNLTYTIVVSLLLFFSVTTLAAPALFAAQSQSDINARANNQACESIGGCSGGEAALSKTIATVINILSAIGGIIAIILIIIGGVKYMTSGGDSNSAANARNTVLYAIVGLIIVVFAQVIVRFVLQQV